MLTPLSILSLDQGKSIYREPRKPVAIQPKRRLEAVAPIVTGYLRRLSARLCRALMSVTISRDLQQHWNRILQWCLADTF